MSEVIDFTKLAIVTVTHARPKLAKETIEAAIASVPDFQVYYLIGNHPGDGVQIGDWFCQHDKRCRFISTGRTSEHTGRLAETWNLAMQWAFRDPQIQWLWCMHDDVKIVPGWVNLTNNRPAELYVAPFGDMCFLLNRNVFEKVGWFDERYTGIGYQDNDWFIRVGWKVGVENIVMEHEGNFPGATIKWMVINQIGLKNHWVPTTIFKDRGPIGLDWYTARWKGSWVNRMVDWTAAIKNGPFIPDVDWYPWFDGVKRAE